MPPTSSGTRPRLSISSIFCRRFAGPFTGGVVDVRRDEIDQVMRDAFALFERDFGGGDLDLFVDLDRITVDDFAVEFEGDFDSERAFAGSGWADDRDDWILRGHEMSITTQTSASTSRPPMT